jgi:hypothetical protein
MMVAMLVYNRPSWLIDDVLFIGLGLIIFTKQEKRLGDWVAGTVVVQEGQTISPQEIAIDPAAQNLVDRLVETGQIGALTPDDFAMMRRYLQRYPFLASHAQIKVSHQLAEQILEIIQLSDRSIAKDPHLFIQAVYFVYQQQFRS